MLELSGKGRIYSYPCSIEESLAPDEIEAELVFGGRSIFVLASSSMVNRRNNTIQVAIIGQSDDTLLVSLPGEVENAGQTIKVRVADFDGGKI